MIIDGKLITELVDVASKSPRLRANYCLHQSQEDKVQRMVNVLLVGTKVPIHRHLNSAETLFVCKGKLAVILYSDDIVEEKRVVLSNIENFAIDIPSGKWHTVEITEEVALLEVKEGPYRPLLPNEIIEL